MKHFPSLGSILSSGRHTLLQAGRLGDGTSWSVSCFSSACDEFTSHVAEVATCSTSSGTSRETRHSASYPQQHGRHALFYSPECTQSPATTSSHAQPIRHHATSCSLFTSRTAWTAASLAATPCSSVRHGACDRYGILATRGGHAGCSLLSQAHTLMPMGGFGARMYHQWYYRSGQISTKIMACQELGELQSLVRAAGNRFSYINWTHVLQRLAALRPQGEGQAAAEAHGSRADEVLRQRLLLQACNNVKKGAKWFNAQYAGLAITALGHMGHQDLALVDAVLDKAMLRMDEAYTRDLAAVCRGLAELSHAASPQWWEAVYAALARKLPTGRVPANALVSILYSGLRLNQPVPPPLLSSLATDVVQRLPAYSPRDVAWLVRVLARWRRHMAVGEAVGAASEEGLVALAGHLLVHSEHCTPRDLLNFLHSASRLLPHHQRVAWAQQDQQQQLLQRLAAALADRQLLGSFSPARLVDAVAIFARLGQALPQDVCKVHIEVAAQTLPIMGNTLRSALREQYERLGVLPQAMAVPAVAAIFAKVSGLPATSARAAAAAAAAAPTAADDDADHHDDDATADAGGQQEQHQAPKQVSAAAPAGTLPAAPGLDAPAAAAAAAAAAPQGAPTSVGGMEGGESAGEKSSQKEAQAAARR